jgi:hypothetical protein
MDIEAMKPVSGREAYAYFAELYRDIVPMERALTLADSPLRARVAELMEQHRDAVDDAVIRLSFAADKAAMAAIIAALPEEHFYVLSTRWVNNTAQLLPLADRPVAGLPPGQDDLRPLIRLCLVARTERIGTVSDLWRAH